jgi:hypothetical protein
MRCPREKCEGQWLQWLVYPLSLYQTTELCSIGMLPASSALPCIGSDPKGNRGVIILMSPILSPNNAISKHDAVCIEQGHCAG